MKRTIAVITTSRSDYAHLHWLLRDLAAHPSVDLRVIALGPHLSPEFGHTGKQLLHLPDKTVTTVECLLSSDTDIGMAKTLGIATLGLADVLGRMRPDILVLTADRYEMLAPASVALTLRIPIAHIEGGETTSGAIDDAVRNAITKMAHLHFACTRQAQKRILALGEKPWRVTWSGSLSLDDLRRSRLLNQTQLKKKLGITVSKETVIAVYHPVTLRKDTAAEAGEMFSALEESGRHVVIVYPNADAGSRKLISMAERFTATHSSSRLFVNLDHVTYLSLLKHAGVLIGNSSSGMIESTSLKIPAINIGLRQQGREYAANVLNVAANKRQINQALQKAFSPEFRKSIPNLENPYGDGRASQRIVKVLSKAPLGEKLLFKRPS